MESWRRYAIDDDESLPRFQLSAITQALLAKSSTRQQDGTDTTPTAETDSAKQPSNVQNQAGNTTEPLRYEHRYGNGRNGNNTGRVDHSVSTAVSRGATVFSACPTAATQHTNITDDRSGKAESSKQNFSQQVEPPRASPERIKCLPEPNEEEAPPPPIKRVIRKFTLNDTPYFMVRKLGKGGSGRVYEVMNADNVVFAYKTIPLKKLDAAAKKQVENEVALLQKLRRAKRAIHLVDWELNEVKNTLSLLMEPGQVDLETLIRNRVDAAGKLDLVFISQYWVETLRCVASVHALDVVHSDIKPANFVLCGGILKLIDFGIASAVPDDTVNVYQYHQAGTPNYMAPESLMALSSTRAGGDRAVRFGKPSDVWSLGCILHLMFYGALPFAHIRHLPAKLMAIVNPGHVLEFEASGLRDAPVPAAYLRTMRACLSRDPARRPTVHSLLASTDGLVMTDERGKRLIQATPQSIGTLLTRAMADTGVDVATDDEVRRWALEALEQYQK